MKLSEYRVLLIEDDPIVQEVNRQFINSTNGFLVMGTASNGKEGLQKIEKLKPDLVILDIFMPELDGLETLHEIRKEGRPVDVIVVTAAEDMKTVHQALRHGAIDYIVKPFKFERLQQALENYRRLSELKNKGTTTQEELDQWFSSAVKERSNTPTATLPKGLNAITLDQVILYLKQSEEAKSADEVAEQIGIARVTAWRYLDFLEKQGQEREQLASLERR